MTNEKKGFCIECREDVSYEIRKVIQKRIIREKEYEFEVYEAFCEKCKEPMNIKGLMDTNIKEIDKQYREQEGIITIEDIDDLMSIYNIGKAPLSLALGFGEVTITRYLKGQIPSKEYSDIIKKALENPSFMMDQLKENREKIGETAYQKAMNIAVDLKPLFALSPKMLSTISYIFKIAVEVTPLALQKLLYYIQGIHLALHNKTLFKEECQAWVHGPVFKKVYDMFKDFKYDPIDDARFAILQSRFHELSDDEKQIIDLVIDSFGMYSGRILEKLTHNEKPWRSARENYLPDEPSNEVISEESIKEYFNEIANQYQLNDVKSLRIYIHDQLKDI